MTTKKVCAEEDEVVPCSQPDCEEEIHHDDIGQVVALQRAHCVGTACALHAHRVHLLGNSPKITCHMSASIATQQSPQDNNQHMRGHMGPRAIRGVANLAPNTKLG